ncbi:DUF5703 domain-containing protein, partial [Planctomycetota bacterium]
NPFAGGLPFKQELKLRQGAIEINAGEQSSKITIRVWVDANNPVVRVEVEGKEKFDMQVNFETWRETGYTLKRTSLSDMYNFNNGDTSTPVEYAPYPTIVRPDVILRGETNRIIWYHHNVDDSGWPLIMKLQGLESFIDKMTDPLLGRTFGGAIQGEGLVSVTKSGEAFDGIPTRMLVPSDRQLRSSKQDKAHSFRVYILTKHPATVKEWREELNGTIDRIDKTPIEKAREAHQDWWDKFWNRSWIRATGNDDAEEVAKAYTLQRYLFACCGRGTSPVKFNGSLFSLESEDDPDYRTWGPAYWTYDTAILYWHMMATGDFDLMQPYFGMYLDALPLLKAETEIYYNHGGAHFWEQMYFWGGSPMDHYGWDRTGLHVSQQECKYTALMWHGGIEFVAMMQDYFAYTQDEVFLRDKLLPMAEEIITFYDLHYKRDDNGKLYIWPAQAGEAWWDCTNPMPEVAGLRFVLGKLSKLPREYTSSAQRRKWGRLLSEVPELPTRELEDGRTVLAPAEKFAELHNMDCTEMYVIFPYRLYGVGKPGLELVRLTFENPIEEQKEASYFGQRRGTFLPYLGLAEQTRQWILPYARQRNTENRVRGIGWQQRMLVLQSMLMQCEDEKIILFPAWPEDWDVDFKLHAPYNTTIEGIYRNGKLEHLKVTPESRTKDVVKMQPQ